MRCGAVPCRAVRCRAVRCRAVPCGAVPCGAVPCRAVPQLGDLAPKPVVARGTCPALHLGDFSSSQCVVSREITEKKPEVIKTCLTDTQNLCAREMPFYAAVGNRASQDVSAYKQLGLLESHIFTVNPKGELIQELMNHKSTHEQLSEVVELMFPPLGQVGEHGSAVP